MMDAHELQEGLRQHYGTERYYKMMPPLLITDGCMYLAQNAEAYWLFDVIASYAKTIEKKAPEWGICCFAELTVEDQHATFTLRRDKGMKPFVKQEIEYTDFPLDSIKLYLGWNELNGKRCLIACLPSEY